MSTSTTILMYACLFSARIVQVHRVPCSCLQAEKLGNFQLLLFTVLYDSYCTILYAQMMKSSPPLQHQYGDNLRLSSSQLLSC